MNYHPLFFHIIPSFGCGEIKCSLPTISLLLLISKSWDLLLPLFIVLFPYFIVLDSTGQPTQDLLMYLQLLTLLFAPVGQLEKVLSVCAQPPPASAPPTSNGRLAGVVSFNSHQSPTCIPL